MNEKNKFKASYEAKTKRMESLILRRWNFTTETQFCWKRQIATCVTIRNKENIVCHSLRCMAIRKPFYKQSGNLLCKLFFLSSFQLPQFMPSKQIRESAAPRFLPPFTKATPGLILLLLLACGFVSIKLWNESLQNFPHVETVNE